MARALKVTLTLCLAVGLVSIALGQQKQPPRIFGPGFLLFDPGVQKELKLKDEQVDKLRDSLKKVMEDHKDDFTKIQEMSLQDIQKKMRVVSDDSYKAIRDVLDDKQWKRFKQIEWQMNGVGALQDPELQKELKLNDDQKKKLTSIFDDTTKKMQELTKNRETSQEKYQAVIKDTEQKANGVLSDEQKKKLEDLKGPKYEFARPAQPPAKG